jgi:hypothetical protein
MKEEERRKKKEGKDKRERGSEEKNVDWNVSPMSSPCLFFWLFLFFIFCFEKKNFALRFGTSNNTNKKNRETRGKRIQQQHNICL